MIAALRHSLACALALLALAAPAAAQGDYPNRMIKIVVGFAAGGGNDIFARLVGAKLSELIGQNVIIENRPGAGSRLANEYAAHQPADGYTLLVAASGGMSIASAIYPKLGYHPTRSFVPLTMIAHFPLIVAVSAEAPAKTVPELIAWMKAHPDKANYATSSPAFTIATELLKLKTGAPGTAIPYKSSNESIVALLSGQTLLTIADGPPTVPQVKSGKIRALAVTGAQRSEELPDVPSMAEAGFPDINTELWSGVFVQAGTPQPIVDKLQAVLRRVITDPDVSTKLKAMAVTPGGGPPDEFRAKIEADIKSAGEVVKAAHLEFPE
ncbi:MAG: tripartite tricarboxylate transporter substrate binding protein [Alphaproteobacteria bacterium]|nr:tripartite tricarboxylate transporter substrate binding protein [Alphaproteobacteria bacterium]